MQCYTHYLEISINEAKAKELEDKLQSEIERTKSETLVIHNREINKIKEDNKGVENALREQINRLSREIEEKETRMLSINFSAEAAKEEKIEEKKEENKTEENKEEVITEYISKLKTLEIENQELKRKLVTIHPEPKAGCLSSCIIQ